MKLVTLIDGVVEAIRPAQGIRDLKNAGFENAVLALDTFCHPEELWPDDRKVQGDALRNPDTIRAGYQAFLQICRETGMGLPIGRLVSLRTETERRDLDDKVRNLAIEGIAACEDAGCRYIIAPSLFAGVDAGREWEENKSFYLDLAYSCQKSETQILLKNQCRNVWGHLIRGNCAEAEEAVKWVNELNDAVGAERFGFCLDMGVCNICGQDVHEMITTLGNLVKAVLLCENDGLTEKAFLPFAGHSMDWLGLIRGFRDISFDGMLVMDYGATAGSFSPLLKPLLLPLARSVGDYFIWQVELEKALRKYDSIVLFGAGNMCRNYMKNYGEAYPPLFTCDNNADRWGEMFCGLEIKPPEALKNLQDNCGIFVCNVYYREIEKQLRDMGLQNIEFFNDEYMASFHMDRLERK